MDLRQSRIAATLLVFLAAAAVAHGFAMALDDPGFKQFANEYVYYSVLAVAAGACLLRAATIAEDRLAWTLIGAGALAWVAGDIVWIRDFGDVAHAKHEWAADALNLAHYPLTAAGVLVLARGRLGRLRGAAGLDVAIAGIGAAAVGAVALGPALALYAESDLGAAILNTAYPTGDVVIVCAAAAGAAILGGRRDFVLLGLGIVALAVADTAYLYEQATTGYVDGTLLDTGWMIAAALIGLAAWQASGRESETAVDEHSIAMPSLTALLAVGLMVVDHFTRLPETAILLAGVTLVLSVLRMILAFNDSTRLLRTARSDSLTDSLTGLGNRRRLVRDLGRATENAGQEGSGYLFVLFDLDGFKTYNDSFGHAAGDLLLRRMGTALAAAVEGHGDAYRLGGDEFCVLGPLGRSKPSSVIAAATAALREDGEAFVITASHGRAMIPAEAPTPSQALRLADRRLYAEKGRSSRSFERQARDLLLAILRERQPRLGTHMEGVGELAAGLARRLGLETEDVDVIGRAGELHDIGKMAIPDDVLTKPGPLDDAEWELMRKHTLIGERMLSVTPALAPVAPLIRWSHERWDGDGYPDRLAGPQIPVGSRIIAICDAYEAMIEKRPYRPPMTAAEAIAELRRNAGAQFDPKLVELFIEVLSTSAATPPVRI